MLLTILTHSAVAVLAFGAYHQLLKRNPTLLRKLLDGAKKVGNEAAAKIDEVKKEF